MFYLLVIFVLLILDTLNEFCCQFLYTITSEASWKIQRKAINPAFNQQVLDGFLDTFNGQAQALADQFANEVGKPFNHEYILRENIFNTLCLTELGVNPESFINFQKHYFPYFEEGLSAFNERLKKFWLHYDFIFNMSSLKKRATIIVDNLVKITDLIIQKKKDDMKNNKNYNENQAKNYKPFLEHILKVSEKTSIFTDELIRGNTATVIAGGYDPNASALTFALTLLGSYPQVQEKAYNEVLQLIGNSKSNVDKEVLSKFVYIEAILKETLRLYPSLPLVARQLDKDIKLKNYILKANSHIIISLIGANYHKMWGPDAEIFRPERWLDSETLPDPKYFASFALGRRGCIGKTYAFMLLKIIIVNVLQRYRISSDISKMVIKIDTTIKPASGHFITLEERNM